MNQPRTRFAASRVKPAAMKISRKRTREVMRTRGPEEVPSAKRKGFRRQRTAKDRRDQADVAGGLLASGFCSLSSGAAVFVHTGSGIRLDSCTAVGLSVA